ncbi:MAG: SCO family protein [Acidobacteria bacterium]|nr:SCO family protein [Acidobacteriota bacterium]
MRTPLVFGAVGLALVLAVASRSPLMAQDSSAALPKALEGVSFEQRLGEELPLDAVFRDETGQQVTLGSFFGERPVILALVYYDCPMLCTMVLGGLSAGLKPLDFDPGQEFEVVVVSFDPRETPEMAAESKAETLSRYGREGAAVGWHFLTGEEAPIRRLADAMGFTYQYQEETGEYAHAAGIVVATPEGRSARYLYGIDYAPRALRLALVEASEGKIGSAVDQVLLFCYHYDPATGKYSTAVMNLVQAGGVITVLLLVGFFLVARRRELGRPAVHRSVGTA